MHRMDFTFIVYTWKLKTGRIFTPNKFTGIVHNILCKFRVPKQIQNNNFGTIFQLLSRALFTLVMSGGVSSYYQQEWRMLIKYHRLVADWWSDHRLDQAWIESRGNSTMNKDEGAYTWYRRDRVYDQINQQVAHVTSITDSADIN